MSVSETSISYLKVAVLIPCLNEESTIGKVVSDFKKVLPDAQIYVYDNNSNDGTVGKAIASGAIVQSEYSKGKGNVVRRMFADVESDVYVLVDGDDTYDARSVITMIEYLVEKGLDMVNGARSSEETNAFRPGHRIGNRVLTKLVKIVFGRGINDMLSGFRVFSRRFVKSFPAMSHGFEVETELTVHSLEMRLKIGEIETPYKGRTKGSSSKLSTIRDGLSILRVIMTFIKEERPMRTFSVFSAFLALISTALAVPIFIEYSETGLVPRFPTAILCTALMILSFFSFYTGLILDTMTTARREMKRLYYLQHPAINGESKVHSEIVTDKQESSSIP